MEKIMLIKIVKSEQYKKFILNYVKADKESNKSYKGYTEFTQWIDNNNDIFDKLEKEDFGKVIDATMTVTEPNFKGECKYIIKDFIVNGKKIEIN